LPGGHLEQDQLDALSPRLIQGRARRESYFLHLPTGCSFPSGRPPSFH